METTGGFASNSSFKWYVQKLCQKQLKKKDKELSRINLDKQNLLENVLFCFSFCFVSVQEVEKSIGAEWKVGVLKCFFQMEEVRARLCVDGVD